MMKEPNFAKFYKNLLFIFNKILFQMFVDHFVVFSNDGDWLLTAVHSLFSQKNQQKTTHSIT